MTNQQGAPEALRLAEILEGDYCPDWFYEQGVDEVAAELRRLHAENERLAALVEAQQPAPSAAAAAHPSDKDAEGFHQSSAAGWKLHGYRQGTKEGIAFYRGAVWWYSLAAAPQPSPTPQADSQPAPVAAFEVADAMADSQYLAGVSAGWNAANADDPNAALQKLHESRAGYLKPLLAARAPADSVQGLQPVHDAVTIDLLNERVTYLEGKLNDVKAADSVLEDAGTALRKVLGVVQQYLPPDGLSIQDAMSKIIAIVDPWPIGTSTETMREIPTGLSADQISLMAFNDDPGDWNSLSFRECWIAGYKTGARAAIDAKIAARKQGANHD